MLNFKKIIALCASFLLALTLMPPALAIEPMTNPLDEMSVGNSLEDGEVKLVDSHNCVVLYIDRPTQLEGANTLGSVSNAFEQRECIATILVPYDPETNDALYDELEKNMPAILQSAQDGYHEIPKFDQNKCAEFKVGVYYTKELKDDHFTYYDLTKVVGGYTDSGTSGDYVGENVYVTHQYLDVGQIGTSYDGEKCLDQTTFDYQLRASDRDWTYTPPLQWKAVCGNETMCAVGATYHFTLARGSSSWSDQIVISALT